MRILVLGGLGYVGNALIQQLHNREEVTSIHIYDNLLRGKEVLLQQSVKNEKIRFTEGDILDNYQLKKALKDADVVIHLATITHPAGHHYIEQINHWGTANICNLIEENPIKRFIFLSISDIYGSPGREITIDATENPQTPLAKSMFRAEKYVKNLRNKCEIAIVRTAPVYGYNPVMHFKTGLNKHLFEAKYNKLLQLDADGLHRQSAVHINDLSKLLKHIIIGETIEQIYLVSTEKWSGVECYEALKAFYPDLECTFISHHLRLPDVLVKTDIVSSEIIRPKVELAKAIEEFIQKTNY